MVFVDESGFSLTPYRGRTWAPRGKTPILRHCCNWPKLSAISGVTPSLKVYMQLVKGSIRTPQVIHFARHLLNHIPGPICLFWDNNSPHKSKLTQETLAGFAPRLSVYRLPSYAPELNPDEGVWHYLKCDALRGFCPAHLKELINKIHRATKSLRRRPALVQSFFRECPLFFDAWSSYL